MIHVHSFFLGFGGERRSCCNFPASTVEVSKARSFEFEFGETMRGPSSCASAGYSLMCFTWHGCLQKLGGAFLWVSVE